MAEEERIHREITSLRAREANQTQLGRRVELDLELKRLASLLAEHRLWLKSAFEKSRLISFHYLLTFLQ